MKKVFLVISLILSASASHAANDVCFLIDGQVAKFETKKEASPTSFKIATVDALENWSKKGNLIAVVSYNGSTIYELNAVEDSHVFYSALIVDNKKVTFTTRGPAPQKESYKRVSCQ